MRLRKTLLLSFEGDGRLISELKSIVRMGHCGEFQVEEETLPTAAGRDLGPILQEVLTRISPTVIVLGIPQNFNDHAEPVFRILRRQGQEIPVFVVLESTRPEDVFAMLELGATDFAVAPLRAYDLLPRLRRLRPVVNESNSKVSQLKERLGLKQFIGESPTLTEAIKLIPKLARCDASVFITGETGTGKEMFARALHYLSPRSGRPFIPVNCGAIPAELVENELFGHERGAFTGATSSARGLIHDADGGTLFLDEIDSLPLPTQVKLLRFLQDRTAFGRRTFGLWPRRTPRSRRPSAPANSAPICFIASTSSFSSSRRSANAGTTFRCLPGISSPSLRANPPARPPVSRRPPCKNLPATIGRATCANSKTSSSAPWSSASNPPFTARTLFCRRRWIVRKLPRSKCLRPASSCVLKKLISNGSLTILRATSPGLA